MIIHQIRNPLARKALVLLTLVTVIPLGLIVALYLSLLDVLIAAWKELFRCDQLRSVIRIYELKLVRAWKGIDRV